MKAAKPTPAAQTARSARPTLFIADQTGTTTPRSNDLRNARELGPKLFARLARCRRERRPGVAALVPGDIKCGFQPRHTVAARDHPRQRRHERLQPSSFRVFALLNDSHQTETQLWFNRSDGKDSADRTETQVCVEDAPG